MTGLVAGGNLPNSVLVADLLTSVLNLSLVQTFADTGAWIVRSQKGFENKTSPAYQDVLSAGFLSEVDRKRLVPAGK